MPVVGAGGGDGGGGKETTCQEGKAGPAPGTGEHQDLQQ